MKEAFDMKNFLLWGSKFSNLFFFAICYISSLSGQILINLKPHPNWSSVNLSLGTFLNPGGGTLGYFLGGYVPPGTPAPRSRKKFP